MYTADVEKDLNVIQRQINIVKSQLEQYNEVECLKDMFLDFLSEIEYHLDEIEKFVYNINS